MQRQVEVSVLQHKMYIQFCSLHFRNDLIVLESAGKIDSRNEASQLHGEN